MELDGNTFFFYNKKYDHARLAQWGTDDSDLGTCETDIDAGQLWILEADRSQPGYFYIHNAKYEGFRLAKYGEDDDELCVYRHEYYGDQLWRFQKEGESDYYRIYNKKYPSAKLVKWGKSNSDMGTFAGPDYDDQLWKLVSRFQAKAKERDVFEPIDNRKGKKDIQIEVTVINGLKLTKSSSLSTKVGFEYSLKRSMSAGIDGIKAGTEETAKFTAQIESSISSGEEKYWSKEIKKKYTIPAGKKYRAVQTVLDFSSKLNVDDCSLFCLERIEESD